LVAGAAQFSSGYNAIGTSLQIGSRGIRIHGKDDPSVAGSIRNGDLWVNDGGTVLVRSRGTIISI